MRTQSLKLKVSLYLTIALSAMLLLFMLVIVKHQRDELVTTVTTHLSHISEVIARSTRHAMLLNEPVLVNEIINDIGQKEAIERVRVLSKEGFIANSNVPLEIGELIDHESEACVICHGGKDSPPREADSKRWRAYHTIDGRAMLGSMTVIRNEETCAGSDCHSGPDVEPVLGVVDVTYSLDAINSNMAAHVINIVLLALGFIVLVSLSVGLLLHRLIYLPLQDLSTGATRLSAGDLDRDIPVRSADEFGRLAESFNLMQEGLRRSRQESKEWVQTLEQKVQERTRELRIAEAGIIQGEKLAAVGQLAAGIAHELNNPLTGVLTFTHLLRQKMPDGSPDAEDLDLVIRETKRCAAIIRRLLDFAREKASDNTPADLNQVILDTVRFVERSAAIRQIEIVADLDPSIPHLAIDGDLMKQVLMNMLVNAEQAIGEQGTITVRSLFLPGGESEGEGAGRVEIKVADTGCGIPEDHLQRVFDPFFTSKEVGKGTGLGLSVSYGIVKAYGGEITVASTVGEGSTFRILLPLTPSGEPAGRIVESAQ
jgi:two-component system, NtrC family, sensor kinase